MKKFCGGFFAGMMLAAAMMFVGLQGARAEVVVQIDKSSQRMTVSVDGTMRYNISRLGGPASHGCVRLHPANAATLFALVARNGARNTTIEISNWLFLTTR